jgi:hypothetical protein
MPGAGRNEDQRAGVDFLLLPADDHQSATTGDDVDLLLRFVAVDLLLAARLAVDPGYRQVLRTEVALPE